MGKGLNEIPRGAEHVMSVNYGYNYIADLPDFIFFLNGYRSVHKIELYQNKIANVSQKAFKELKQLKTLDLSGNNISTLDTGTFKWNLKLQKLDLSNNRISFHRVKPFLTSASLETLILTDNRIEQIFEATFVKLPNLRILMMDNNIIFSIEQSSFASMHLHYLSLANTGVYRLGEDMFMNDSYPRVIDLTDTPLANKFDPPLRKVKKEGVINLLALDRYF
ncbi:unnamed protein product [Phaedon cochleariae]|uniref:Uncharacterized protein n=1 Tax=Phaedon cochleariae TaxID=80249 RepID=A0A9N9SDX9_PHACE|nr:unnamed protein product [Phaedon cochleariae]